ncbi:pilus assembly protein TadG-related protein [Neobacillus niacini]|uniref:pilus assembly protein TadG-related protein n=1 Tax=Neobacillus niacini TaxID=86668 RepID=UPI0021CB5A88|nr:pilus assembly protein TadG-related protein [Neobacillus niacini]MCM3765803.1 pilus assembly protein TadG-related protein [Neobacillus niacini]
MYKIFLYEEKGQSLVLIAVMLAVLIGFAGVAIDGGRLYATKSDLQKAADAAALAGAQELPNASTSRISAEAYAKENGVKQAEITSINSSYQGDTTKIEVNLTRKVSFTFARVLGFTSTDIPARAVAQNDKWDGEALPFINLDNKYGAEGTILKAWNKVDPGDKERIHNDDLVISKDNTSIKVKYQDGSIMFKKGKDNSINAALDNILKVGRTVYLFSLSNKVIDSGVYQKKGSEELKNKDLIPLKDTVLLECEIVEVKNKIVTLKFMKVYDISAGVLPKGDTSKLIE